MAISIDSNITERTAIPDYYVTDLKSGWIRSSGFAGDSGKFSLTATANRLLVKVDSTVSGTSNGYYEIVLNYNIDGTPTNGETVAEDLKVKIRALEDSLDTVDVGYKAAYRNVIVEYKDSKFWVVSGTVSKFYTGNSRSYVDIISGSTNDALAVLGFDLKTSSAVLDSVPINEALILEDYPTVSGSLTISQNIGASRGDCLIITNRNTTDYFQLDDDPTSGGTGLSFDVTAISNNYTANGAKVQLLREQDPDAGPTTWFNSFDKITRHGVMCMINYIDFSE
jgi:hypothetical protein